MIIEIIWCIFAAIFWFTPIIAMCMVVNSLTPDVLLLRILLWAVAGAIFGCIIGYAIDVGTKMRKNINKGHPGGYI
jgi:hypothetical protein